MANISWYTIAPDLKLSERGAIDLNAALHVIDDYFARLRPKYESAEAALAETMFGFSRDSHDFIEVCLHSASQISLTVELPGSPTAGWLARLRGPYRREYTVGS